VSDRSLQLSCPDWRRLAAERDAAPGDPAGWEDALRHLDGGCPRCRAAAIAADPLLAFRRLPAPGFAADEADAMRLRVAALRGAAAVTAPARAHRDPRVRRTAAAAVVALAVLAGGNLPHNNNNNNDNVSVALAAPRVPALDAALAAEPVLEDLDQPFDHVVQWNGDDLSVVLVVDGRLSV
jgi:hypothetical protein